MILLGIDIGTTHCKAGLFRDDGTTLKIVIRQMIPHLTDTGETYFDPQELWQTVENLIKEATTSAGPVAAVGIASMAETGLLVDRNTGEPRSNLIPWFDTAAQPHADMIRQQSDPLERFLKTGLRANFKCSLAKLLWLRERSSDNFEGAIWLSVADYIGYRLTGNFKTDYSLAGFTFAFRVDNREWDTDWLEKWGLSPELFPPLCASGSPIGQIRSDIASQLGVSPDIPVSISGHDHAAAAFAMGVVTPQKIFNSMGTAETLIGVLPHRLLTEADYLSGLLYNPYVSGNLDYWLGSLSASGGSIEWLRAQLGEEPLSYTEIDRLLEMVQLEPTGILYFPYLLGSGSPHADPLARGAFVGLSASHGRGDLLKAVLEGTSYEVELIRQVGERVTGQPISSLVAAGGGSRNLAWLQIKADVSGCRIEVSAEPEATLLGAALIAGIGCGLYRSEAEALSGLALPEMQVYVADEARHEIYQKIFEQGYLRLQDPIRAYYSSMNGEK